MSGKHQPRRGEAQETASSGRGSPGGSMAFPVRRDVFAVRRSAPAAQARRDALARWPLLAEIDQALSRQASGFTESDTD
ncbi:hypothetical protein [uncultured Castellaniella sp.]|uniref:hypothetical protein n=1 Tax=uncultured Castellaniella sp. TaxID=647907 RepID=UPI00260A84B4|nr:hypothetical protein [uncultured Castellaniella sp.]